MQLSNERRQREADAAFLAELKTLVLKTEKDMKNGGEKRLRWKCDLYSWFGMSIDRDDDELPLFFLFFFSQEVFVSIRKAGRHTAVLTIIIVNHMLFM